MFQEIFYDHNNKCFAIVNKFIGRPSKLIKIISEDEFDDQLRLILNFKNVVDFANDLQNEILIDYKLYLKIAKRRLSF
jgi:hypothetical protein